MAEPIKYGPNVFNYTKGYNEKSYWDLTGYVDAQLRDKGIDPDKYNIGELELLQYADDVDNHNNQFSHYVSTVSRTRALFMDDDKSDAIEAMAGLFNGDFDSIKISDTENTPGHVNKVGARIRDWSSNLWDDSGSNIAGNFIINFSDGEIYDRLFDFYGSRLNKIGAVKISKEKTSNPSDYVGAISIDNQNSLPLLMMYLHLATHNQDITGETSDWNGWNKFRELFGSYQRWDIEGLNGENSRRQTGYNQRSSRNGDTSGFDFDEIDEFGREMVGYYKTFMNYTNPKEEDHYVPVEYTTELFPLTFSGGSPAHTYYELLHPDAKSSELKDRLKDDVNNKLNTKFKNMPQGSILFEHENDNGEREWSQYRYVKDDKGNIERISPDDTVLEFISERVNSIMKGSDPWHQVQMYRGYDENNGKIYYTAVTLIDETNITQSNKDQANNTNTSARTKLADIKRVLIPNLFGENINEEFQSKFNTDEDKKTASGEVVRASNAKYKVRVELPGDNRNIYIQNRGSGDGEHLFLLVGEKEYDLDFNGRKFGSNLAGRIIKASNNIEKFNMIANFYNNSNRQDKSEMSSKYEQASQDELLKIVAIINALGKSTNRPTLKL